MASGYIPQHFMHSCDPGLLTSRLHSYSSPPDQADPDPPEASFASALRLYNDLSSEQRARADADFRAVQELASDTGIQLLFEEGTAEGLDLAAIFAESNGRHTRALWMLMHHRAVFERCYRFHEADQFSERTWQRIRDEALLAPLQTDEPTTTWLSVVLQSMFQQREGRGRSCHVEWDRRGNRMYCFVHLENYGTEEPEFSENGLDRPLRRPAFLVVFVHNQTEGTLHVHFRGRKAIRQELVRSFGMIALGVSLNLRPDRDHAYQLDLLKSRGFTWAVDPAWGIQRVWVKTLRLRARHGNGRSAVLNANTARRWEAVYDFMEELFDTGTGRPGNAGKPSIDNYEVDQVVVAVEFETGSGLKRDPFRITLPNHCNLGHEGIDLHLHHMLVRSGIDPAPPRVALQASS